MFLVGMCLLMHSVLYKVEEVEQMSYLLSREVTVHEKVVVRKESWKKTLIDEVGKEAKCK